MENYPYGSDGSPSWVKSKNLKENKIQAVKG